jgi:transcriptional regulator with XRE-family HTH domain
MHLAMDRHHLTTYVNQMTNASLTESLAATIRELMENQGRSVNNLADSTGIPFSTLRRRVRGLRPFTTTELDLVATELGTDIATLFTQASAIAPGLVA